MIEGLILSSVLIYLHSKFKFSQVNIGSVAFPLLLAALAFYGGARFSISINNPITHLVDIFGASLIMFALYYASFGRKKALKFSCKKIVDNCNYVACAQTDDQLFLQMMNHLKHNHFPEAIPNEIKVKILYKLFPNGDTPLYRSVLRGNRFMLTAFLRSMPFAVNLKVEGGTTPLHIAVRKGHIPIVRMLIQSGADPYSLDDNNLTPIDVARIENNDDIIEVLSTTQVEHETD